MRKIKIMKMKAKMKAKKKAKKKMMKTRKNQSNAENNDQAARESPESKFETEDQP